jgi:integrase/recombinase XerD
MDTATHQRFRRKAQATIGWTMADFLTSVRDWDEHMTARGMAVTTRQSYRYQVTRFLGDVLVSPVDVTEQHVVAYIAAIGGNGSGRGQALRGLKSYFHWLSTHGWRDDDPTSELRVKNLKNRTIRYISEEDLPRVFAAAAERDRKRELAMRLCYYTGARVESLAAIRPEDISLSDGVVRLNKTKGDRPYVAILGQAGRRVAAELLDMYDPASYTLLGIKARTFWLWCHEAGEAAGVHCSPHMLRHSMATHLLARGVDIRTVQEMLNHQSLADTQRYAATTDTRKRDAAEVFEI